MNTYNTGRVKIGLLYQPSMPVICGDALLLQTALLESNKRSSSTVKRLINLFWRWC